MTIIRTGRWAGYFDWAVRDPGPEERLNWFNGARTPMDSIIHHRMEGHYTYPNGYIVIRDDDRKPTLWHGTINNKTGVLYQHAPVFLRTQHAHDGNVRGPGFELTGYALEWDEKLGRNIDSFISDEAVETFLHIHHDMREYNGIDYKRAPETGRGLLEHHEAAFDKTTCPRNTYAPLWDAIANGRKYGDGNGMEPELKELLENLAIAVFAGGEWRDDKGKPAPREERLKRAVWMAKETAEGKRTSVDDKAASALTLIVKASGATAEPNDAEEMERAIRAIGAALANFEVPD